MKYAVIRSGGKQYRVSEGETIDIERLPAESGKVTFNDVLLYTDGTDVKIGKPLLSGIQVNGVLLENVRGEKIRVAKYKAKVRYRRVTGHRQALSRVKIETIGTSSTKETKETPVKKARVSNKKTE